MVSHDCHMIKQTPWHHLYDMSHKSSTMHPSWLQHYTHWYDCHMTQGDREVLHFVALILFPLQPYDHQRVVAEYQPASPVSLTSKVPHPLLYFDPKLLSGGNGPIYTRVSYRIIFIESFIYISLYLLFVFSGVEAIMTVITTSNFKDKEKLGGRRDSSVPLLV